MKSTHLLRLNILFVLVCFYQLVNAQVQNVTQLTNHVTIQAAITAANPGDVIELSAGSYSEVVTITKSLTLRGASADKTLYVVDGTGLGTNSGITISNGVTNVTIQNLTVQDFTGVNGNSHAGIYGIGGNDNLTVTNVALLNNINASGFYANGPISNVFITNSMVNSNGSIAGISRGIVIWNGLKTNINITGNTVNNNVCCGIELQDGNASDVDVSNNTLDIGAGDNAIGITGLNPSTGLNTINNNIITGGGRFGIEIKNPAGGVTASGNMITLLSQNTNMKDRAGIAIMRRVVQAGNADVPNGVTLTGNTIDGYQQSSVSEGFGIVVEGTNHSVTGNTVTNCEVGILQQQNPSNYPGDADDSNVADLYFGRANSPMTCGNTISGNTLSANGTDTRDIGVGYGLVTNINTGEKFCFIQAAIDDAQTLAGHSLTVAAGTFNEDVLVNKQLTIVGAGIDQSYVYGPIGGSGVTFQITALGVILDGFTISRIGNNLVDWNNGGLNSVGVGIQGFTASAEVRNCKMTGNRTGIDINASNGNNIHNNLITFNRTGMILRNQTDNTVFNENEVTDNWTAGILFLDASGGTNIPVQQALNSSFNNNKLTGNWYGQIVDRQSGGALPAPGSNLKNFDCNWFGTITPVVSVANSAEPGYASLIPVAYGGGAVPPGGQPDILGPASANFDYLPYLINGTDSNGGEIGFQPAPNSCSGCPSGSAVLNTTTGEYFCSIQEAINDAQTLAGHTLEISSGTYNEQVLVTKGVILKGVGMTQPLINFTGTVTGKPTLIDVSADGVTIENIHFNVDLANLRSAIIASAPGLDNITVKDNVIDAYGTPAGSYGDRNAVSVNYNGNPANYRVATGGVNNVVFTGNTVNGTGPGSYFRSGLSLDEGGGTITGNTLTTINHDILVRFAGNGPITITGNMSNFGGIELSDANAAAGLQTVSGNTFTGTGAPGTAILRIKNNYNGIPHLIANNTFNGYEWGVSLENVNSVTLDGNNFNTANAGAKAVVINTKSISSNSSDILQVPVGATFLNNNFNGTGTGLLFANHDSDNDSYGSFVLGTAGNENDFAASLSSFITLDAQTGSTNGSTFPVYPNTGMWPTTMDYWAFDMNAANNNFDVGAGLQMPAAMSLAQLGALEGKIYHTMDVAALGLVVIQNNNLYVTPALSPTASDNDYTRIKNAIESAPNNFTINLNGTFDWTEANAAASWALGNDGVAATGDDYSILVPANRNGITFTAPLGLGTSTILGPGDLAGRNLEAVLVFEGGDNQNWTISNMTFTGFDMSIAMFEGGGGVDAFNNTTITNNVINMATDLNATVAPADVNQNIGIHFAFGTNQNITNNTFNIAGDGITAGANFSTSIAMQSNTSGGNVYNGLNISGNTINVLNAQSANPQRILGFWENGHAHNSNITISNNQFLNLAGGNNPALNVQRAFRVTSHSGAGSTVTYSGNTVQGANIGFEWITGSNFSAQMPVQLTGNTLTGNNWGMLVQSNGKALLTGNIFDGSTDNATDVQIVAGSTVTSGGGNSWAGEGYYVENLSANALNVSGETFDQVNYYRRADRMYDALDNVPSGLIRFDGVNLYVSAPATGLSDETITNAINISTVGDVINIETGTYTSGIDASLKAITLSPGSSPGCVTLGGNLIINGDDVLNMEVNGTTACTGYDQFVVNGTVSLGGASLNLTLGYAPVNGHTIILINNDLADAVIGQFAQGTNISVGGYYFTINYAGGDGNDVALVACTNVTNTTTLEVFCGIQEAIDDVQTLAGHTLMVGAGTFNEDVLVNKQLTIMGAGIDQSYVYGPIGGSGATFQIAAPGVILDGFTISRVGNNLVDWNNPGLNSAGVAIQGFTATAEVRNCKITGNRTGIDINASNGNNIHNNLITFNRTGLLFRNQTDNTLLYENEITDNWTVGVLFLDASGGTNFPVQQALNSSFNNNKLTGNWYGQIVDRQSGGSLPAPGSNPKNFECNWFGTITPIVSIANSAEPGYAVQIPVAYGGASVPPGGQPDILGPASANFDYLPLLSSGTDSDGIEVGFQPAPNTCNACPSGLTTINATTLVIYCDIQAALDASQPGEQIHITAGTGFGNFEVEPGKVLVIFSGVNFTSNGEICNNGIITVNAGGTYNNAGTYSGKGVFNGTFNNVAGGNVKPGACGL